MNAKDRLLTEGEVAEAIRHKGTAWPSEALTQAQDAKTLRALRSIIEWAAARACYHRIQKIRNCGHCATCQARELLAEMDAQGKGKEEG